MPGMDRAASQPIAEFHDVDAERFRRDIATRYRPAVLRGVVKDWPAVRLGRESPEAIAGYLNGLDSGKTVDTLLMPAQAAGRIFYNDDMSGFNYAHERQRLTKVNELLLRYAKFSNKPSIAVQSALIAECLPGFLKEHRLSLLDESVQPRIWLGNKVVTPAHFDESNNIACVVAGRRRFTLLPPEQIANLYIGPLDYAPTGTPISLVDFARPDLERFPRFPEALAAAQVAELEAGDAIYMPSLWWHHVESLERYNILVNYWWTGEVGANARSDTALDVLLHAIVNLKHLPPGHREAWRSIFDHYVFRATDDLAAHIPPHRRSILGKISMEMARQVKAFLVKQLQK